MNKEDTNAIKAATKTIANRERQLEIEKKLASVAIERTTLTLPCKTKMLQD